MAPLQIIPVTSNCESASSPREPRFFRVVVAALAFACASLALALVGSFATATPASALLRGIDVSSWQHSGTSGSTCGRPIDWVQVRNSGISFAYVKSTEATSYTNPCFAQDWAGIAGVGLLRGSYHYAKPALPLSTAVDQARYFVSRAGSMTGPGDLPGMLDLEETGGLNATQLSEWTRMFMNEVTLLTGKKPVLYMGAFFFPGTIASDISANYRLWLPSYMCQSNTGERLCNPYTDTRQPRLPAGWSSWTWWQFSSIENVPGIYANSTGTALDNVDMNFFCCDLASLQALAGSGSGAGSPFGSLDSISVLDPTSASVSGWAIDPDSRGAITVHVYVDGQGYAVVAGAASQGLEAAYPGFGGNHGYSTIVPLPIGSRQICVYGINEGSGVNALLGCRSLGGDPIGIIDFARAVGPGSVEVSGWTIDPNGVTSTNIGVSVGGVNLSVVANEDRPDLHSIGLGTSHGFRAVVQVPQGGSQQVCVTAFNSVGPGASTSLGCRAVVLPSGSPFGSVDGALGGVGSIRISGWGLDPDSASSIDIHVYVDGIGTAFRADQTRDDVASAFPGYGANRGFSGSVSARGGNRTVCAFGINRGSGGNSLLGCRNVQVGGGLPFGSLDAVAIEGGSIRVSGWAIDPDTSSSIPVHVYLEGQGYLFNADGNRQDVARVFPGYGPLHGFSGLLPAPHGSHSVCAYGIDVAGGDGNRLLGCKTVTVPIGNPVGFIDGASIVNGSVNLSGWAIDPDTALPDTVHIYVNGYGFAISANQSRPDLGNPWGLGSDHGWSFSTPRIGNGNQRVCVYALNVIGSGSHQLLGCRDLS
ncbi:GH25_muramidase domain containing protein [Acidimicrobiia bacterium]